MPEDKSDAGHEALLRDIAWLFDQARKNEFHDFKNSHHATPKMALRSYLLDMVARVEKGLYDN